MIGTPASRSSFHQFLGVWKAVFPMAATDFFRARLDAMIDLRDPLAVLALFEKNLQSRILLHKVKKFRGFSNACLNRGRRAMYFKQAR